MGIALFIVGALALMLAGALGVLIILEHAEDKHIRLYYINPNASKGKVRRRVL